MPETLPLLEIESTFIASQMASIASITFMKRSEGSSFEDFEKEIYQTFSTVIEKNPWLCGKLVKKRGKKYLTLLYESTPPKPQHIRTLFQVNPQGLDIQKEMPYDVLAKKLRPYLVANPSKIIDTNQAVTRLILLSNVCKNSQECAILFSISHSVADGHTYYKIFNMLSTNQNIVALNVKRKEKVVAQAIEAVGSKQYHYLTSLPHIFNVLKGMLTGSRSSAFAYLIDEEKIATIKKEIQENDSKGFISSNDIITSTFSNFIQSRLTVMALNFRDKLTGLHDEDMGNYEGAIIYDKMHYSTPLGIRKSLQTIPYMGLDKSLPSFFEGMFCQMGLITNWASFCTPLHFEHTTQTLHLPITNSAGNAPYEMAVIFRPRETELGILYFSKHFTEEAFKQSGIPLAGKI